MAKCMSSTAALDTKLGVGDSKQRRKAVQCNDDFLVLFTRKKRCREIQEYLCQATLKQALVPAERGKT